MSPKELMYIEDTIAHLKFLKSQFNSAAQKFQDQELKTCAQNAEEKMQQLFGQFYQLL